MQSQRTAFVASPQARENLLRAGRAATGRTHPAAHGGSGGGAAAGEPRRWRRRLPARGHWGAAMEGRAAAGTPRAVERGTRPRRLPLPSSLFGDQRTQGRGNAGDVAGDGHGAANSPPDRAQTAEGRARRRWNAGGEPLRERTLDAGPRERARPRPYGSARDRRDGPGGVPKAAARPIFEQKPFLLRIVGKVIFPTVSKRLAFAQARLLCSTGGTVWAG